MFLKPVTIHDKEVLDPYLKYNRYGVCDFSFSNIFIWRNYFKVSYTIHKGFLVILSSSADGVPHFFMPFCKDNCHVSLEEILHDMLEYSNAIKMPFRMIGLTFEMIEELQPIMPQNFIIPKSDICDYIYTSEDLIHLKGKKFHAKRNHINKFNARYSYEYVDIKTDNLEICEIILDKWKSHHDLSDVNIKHEVQAVEDAIKYFNALDLKGGALLVDGKPAAFSMGQPINKSIFAVHIEKALYEIDGSYAKINQEFAAKNCTNYLYINREEDMGIEGLRKSKLSYNPVLLLYKHIGYLSEE